MKKHRERCFFTIKELGQPGRLLTHTCACVGIFWLASEAAARSNRRALAYGHLSPTLKAVTLLTEAEPTPGPLSLVSRSQTRKVGDDWQKNLTCSAQVIFFGARELPSSKPCSSCFQASISDGSSKSGLFLMKNFWSIETAFQTQ